MNNYAARFLPRISSIFAYNKIHKLIDRTPLFWHNIKTLKKGRAHIIPKHVRTTQVQKLKRVIETTLSADKAEDISVIDLKEKSSLADYMLVATGLSQKHIAAVAERLVETLHGAGVTHTQIEGLFTDWVIVDAGNIIVHLFKGETRKLYNLEKMWSMPMAVEAAL